MLAFCVCLKQLGVESRLKKQIEPALFGPFHVDPARASLRLVRRSTPARVLCFEAKLSCESRHRDSSSFKVEVWGEL